MKKKVLTIAQIMVHFPPKINRKRTDFQMLYWWGLVRLRTKRLDYTKNTKWEKHTHTHTHSKTLALARKHIIRERVVLCAGLSGIIKIYSWWWLSLFKFIINLNTPINPIHFFTLPSDKALVSFLNPSWSSRGKISRMKKKQRDTERKNP